MVSYIICLQISKQYDTLIPTYLFTLLYSRLQVNVEVAKNKTDLAYHLRLSLTKQHVSAPAAPCLTALSLRASGGPVLRVGASFCGPPPRVCGCDRPWHHIVSTAADPRFCRGSRGPGNIPPPRAAFSEGGKKQGCDGSCCPARLNRSCRKYQSAVLRGTDMALLVSVNMFAELVFSCDTLEALNIYHNKYARC